MKYKFLKLIVFAVLTANVLVFCKQKDDKPSDEPSLVEEKKDKVIYHFTAIGTEPFWKLSVLENEIIWETPEFFELFEKDGSPELYTLKEAKNNKGSQLSYYITKANCSDGMSDESYDYAVKINVSIDGETNEYKGCGTFSKITK